MRTGASFQESPPSGVTQDTLDSSSSEFVTAHPDGVYRRCSRETQCPGVVLGAGHIGAPCLAREHFQTPRKQVFSTNHTVCAKSLGTVSRSDLEMAETPPKSQVPRCQPRSSRSKDNSLKTTPMSTLTIFPILQEKQTEGKEVK